jgi:hypothetical protein
MKGRADGAGLRIAPFDAHAILIVTNYHRGKFELMSRPVIPKHRDGQLRERRE